MGATPTFSWPYPNLADDANGPAAFSAGLTAVENTVKDTTIQTYTPAWTSDGDTQPSGASTRVGYYRVDHGICHLRIRLTAGPGTSGGTGNLFFSAPLAANATIPRQTLLAHIVINYAGGGIYLGMATLNNGGSLISVYFPASSSDVRVGNWRNAANGNAPATGIPVVPAFYGMVDGSEVVISGAYYL